MHWVDGSVEEGAEVELFRWKDGQFLDSDCHWKRRKIKESLHINAYKAKAGGNLMNLETSTQVDPCWAALNDLILEEGEKRVKACHKWRERFGKERNGNGGGAGGSQGQRTTRLRRIERLVKKQRWSHTDEEDPDRICVLMGAVLLGNRWGTKEGYSVSLGCDEEESKKKGRARSTRKRKGV